MHGALPFPGFGGLVMRMIHLASTIWVVVIAFAGALGPSGLIRALPEWLRAHGPKAAGGGPA